MKNLFALLLILSPLVHAVAAAQASQSPNRAVEAVPRIFVFRVNDATGKGHSRIPELLRDALARELTASGRYEVIPNERVPEMALSPIGFTNPGIRYTDELGAQFGIPCRILNVVYDQSETSFGVTVQIQVDLYDAAARELVFSSTGEGRARGAAGSEGVLSTLRAACASVARQAVAGLPAYRPIEATLRADPTSYLGRIRLNRGANRGFRPGQLVVILSNGRRVGKAIIINADGFASEARIFEIEGPIQAKDVARAVSEFAGPGIPNGPVAEWWTTNSEWRELLSHPEGMLPAALRVGQTRRALEADFSAEGGVSIGMCRRYVLKDKTTGSYYRDAQGRFSKITAEFKSTRSGEDRFREHPGDVITKITGPYLTVGLVVD